MTGLAEHEEGRRTSAHGWQVAEIPGFALAFGFVVLVAAVFGLASAGGWGGLTAVAVIMAGFVAWLTLSSFPRLASEPPGGPGSGRTPEDPDDIALDVEVEPGQH